MSVAQDYKLNENTVTDCFKDVVVAFRKLLYKERDCELPFSKIGKLQIKNKTVTMKFYQEFLDEQNKNWKNRMDNEKKTHQGASYDPDWDADHYEFQVYFINFRSNAVIIIYFRIGIRYRNRKLGNKARKKRTEHRVPSEHPETFQTLTFGRFSLFDRFHIKKNLKFQKKKKTNNTQARNLWGGGGSVKTSTFLGRIQVKLY